MVRQRKQIRVKSDQSNQDVEHLRLLSIFHFVVAGLMVMMSCLPIIHLVIGIAVVSGAFDNVGNGPPPPPMFGWFFIAFAGFFVISGFVMAGVVAIAGQRLKQKRSYLFCMIVAGIECLFTPFGTVLGVFTLVVLMRPSVKEMFEGARRVEVQSSGRDSGFDDDNPWRQDFD